ncbi:MAG: helix-turn-helix domain-containing protein [Gracilibacteraceae bacterium]|nr:helix-turn-helix domain-containing protein [Gracilibacteraceae bacterium]
MPIPEFNAPVAERVQQIIHDKGMKQLAIAQKAGYSEGAFSAMLTGRRVIKAQDVERICRALDVTPNELFCFENELARTEGSK